ncbi:unnamed protein product [Pleuronectes platessa]|uniref:Uncharacterized protein n=1 Tax=Pleuronectes platessa TaxID=8262 RepID=A0A9N7YG84_PLEPL|nr:unnamed protein product [Pleuronectes platessa]
MTNPDKSRHRGRACLHIALELLQKPEERFDLKVRGEGDGDKHGRLLREGGGLLVHSEPFTSSVFFTPHLKCLTTTEAIKTPDKDSGHLCRNTTPVKAPPLVMRSAAKRRRGTWHVSSTVGS